MTPPKTFAVVPKIDPAVPTPFERAEPATVKIPKVFPCRLDCSSISSLLGSVVVEWEIGVPFTSRAESAKNNTIWKKK